jgi:hypothetical protein
VNSLNQNKKKFDRSTPTGKPAIPKRIQGDVDYAQEKQRERNEEIASFVGMSN